MNREKTNIYRQAKNLLDKREAGGELSWEEFQLIKTAELALILRGCPLPEDMPVAECLEELAKSVEGENNMEVLVGKDEGRWPKGTRIRKVNTTAGDAHQDGALGTIVGALGPASPSQRAELIIELAKKGVNGDIEYLYWVEWDDMPGIPVGIADCRIEPIEEEKDVPDRKS